jgi:acyl carrier protein
MELEPGKDVQLISFLDETHKLLDKAQENLLIVARAIQPKICVCTTCTAITNGICMVCKLPKRDPKERPEECETANPDVIKNYIPEQFKLEISKEIQRIIHEKLGTSSEIEPTTNLHTEIDMDSLDAVEITMAFEDFFDITLEDEEAEGITTLQSAIDLIFKKIDVKKDCDYGHGDLTMGKCSRIHSSDSRTQDSNVFHSKFLSNKCESGGSCAFTKKPAMLMPITIESLIDILKECRHCAEYGYKNPELVNKIDEIIAAS